ncbi:MAG TPA: aminotransferase class V-fold PLP-dependent enzyme [Candidatus Nanopelagicaceae bacterium]|nr:aminotransferase class V-fold PLP-dependent enzyme [Candidatus Nanopelagicaceae bacterium]
MTNPAALGGPLELVGFDQQVPLVGGNSHRYVNLDYAASSPALRRVQDAVDALVPWYSSVHRGAGYKSQVSTAAYEGARAVVKSFFHAQPQDVVIFTRNTTDSVNLLASSLADGASVVAFASEHHANLLPWQLGRLRVTYLPAPRSSAEALERLSGHLSHGRTDLVAITGASNVTGEIWPVAELASLAHSNGARLLLDAAQLAPHLPISMVRLGVDYLAASGHKMYAPYGAGVLIGQPDWLAQSAPFLRGGGAVDFVTVDEVLWSSLPERQEAGSPNVVGAVAMEAAAEALTEFGMARLGAEEIRLGDYARAQLAALPGVQVYGLWDQAAIRIGVVPLNVAGYEHSQLAAILSAEYGIGVRHGCFCAHPLMLELMDTKPAAAAAIRQDLRRGQHPRIPGAVRISLGIGTTEDDIDYLTRSLRQIIEEGPSWTYRIAPDSGDYVPDPDPREWPDLPILLPPLSLSMGESS